MSDVSFMLLGAFLSIFLTAVYDLLKRPIIEVDEEINFQPFQDSPKRTHIQLYARNRHSIHDYLPRQRASDVRGFVTIRGKNTIITREPIRWCNSKQPLLPRIVQESPLGLVASPLHLYDEASLREEDYANIFANDSELFDLFLHIHESNETYFFSNKSYKKALGRWDYEEFKILDSELLLKIELRVSGQSHFFHFRIRHALNPQKICLIQN